MEKGITYDGLYIKLGANLDLTNYSWSYDSGAATFNGILDGQCYTVTTNNTLLPNIGTNGVVQKLNVVAETLSGKSILCGNNKGLIQVCSVRGDVPGDGNRSLTMGMICLENTGTVHWCGALGSVYAQSGDDTTCAAMVAKNRGTVDSCFAAVEAAAYLSAEYYTRYSHPLANKVMGYSSDFVLTDSYFNKDLYTYSTSDGTGLTTAVMQSTDFLEMIAGNTIPGAQWVAGSDGYPILQSCGTGAVTFEGYEEQSKILCDGSTVITLKSSQSGTMYYTTDGSDPRTSSTRRPTSSRTATVCPTGDTTISAVLYSGSTYGTVSRLECIYMPGSGTELDPYCIYSKKALDAVRMDPTACYELCADLTFTEEDYAFGGAVSGGWISIPRFSGSFDGNCHSITGLKGTKGGFVDYNRGVIEGLRMLDHRLCCEDDTGPIANNNAGTITRCYARSAYSIDDLPSVIDPTYYSYSGGIAGTNSGTVSYCRVDGVVAGRQVTDDGEHYLGGIVGRSGKVDNCISNALIVSKGAENNIHAGGISGAYSAVDNCLSTATFYIDSRINYDAYIGSISGHFTNSFVSYCVAVFTCVNCGESQDIACDVTAETWEEDGVTIYTATVTFEETVYSDSMSVENPEEDDHEHVAEDCWHCDNDFHWLQCAECGEIMEIEEHIPGTEATEDTSQYCEVCDRIVRTPLGLDWIIDRILDPDSNMFASGYYMQIVEQYGEYIYNTVR